MTEVAETHAVHHEAPQGFIWKYIFSLDHKIIGIQYYLLALFSVFVGMALSVLMRFNLAWPGTEVPILGTLFPVGAPDGVMTPEFYLSLMTIHGTIMVFFVLTTAPQSGFGNYFLPIQIGANDMAFPTLNMLSFWITFVALLVLLASFFVTGGAPISGWTAYPPLSAVGEIAGPGLGTGQTLWILSIAIFAVGSLLGALNFITTTIDLMGPRDDHDASSPHGLGLVCDRHPGSARFCCTAGRRHPPDAGPHRGNEFLYSGRFGG